MSSVLIVSAGAILSRTQAVMSVSTYPGDSAVALTPAAPSATVIDSHSEISAALVAPYAARPGSLATPESEAMAMTLAPRPDGNAPAVRRAGSSRWTLLSVSKTSTTWPKIQRGEGLATSILSQYQGPLARQFASKSPDKFAGVHVSTGVHTGSPILSDSSAWVEARIRNIYDGGDHHIVVCSVLDLQINQELGMHRQPLLFFRAAFSRLAGHAAPYPHTPAGEALRASPPRDGTKTEPPLLAETQS